MPDYLFNQAFLYIAKNSNSYEKQNYIYYNYLLSL